MKGKGGGHPRCGGCGEAMASASGYCPSCGRLAVAVAAKPLPGIPAEPGSDPPERRPRWLHPLVGFAAVILVCFAALFGVVLGLGDDGEEVMAAGEVGEAGLDLEADDGTRIEIPEGAVPEGTEARIETAGDTDPEAPLPDWGELGGPIVVVDVPEPLSVPATLTLPFDRTVFAEDEPLVLTRYDPRLPAWVPVEAEIDREQGVLTVETAELAGRWRISAGAAWVSAARSLEEPAGPPDCDPSSAPEWLVDVAPVPGGLETCAGGAFGNAQVSVAGPTRPLLLEGSQAPVAVAYEGLSRGSAGALVFSLLRPGADEVLIYLPPGEVTQLTFTSPDEPVLDYEARALPELIVADLLYSLAPAIDLTDSSLRSILGCSMEVARGGDIAGLALTHQVGQVARAVRFCSTDLGSSARAEAMTDALDGWLQVLDRRRYVRTALGEEQAGFTITASPAVEALADPAPTADEAVANWVADQTFALPYAGPCPEGGEATVDGRRAICHALRAQVATGIWYGVGVATGDAGVEVLVATLPDDTYAVVGEWRPGAGQSEPPWA